MKLFKKSVALGSILLTTIGGYAQEITLNVSGGMQGLDVKMNNGDSKLKAGGQLGVGYTYFINKHWGVLTGVDVGYYSSKNTLRNSTYATYLSDSQNDLFEYRVKTMGYSEKNTFYTASIPLLVQYRTTGNTQFYVNAGARIHFPFSQKGKVHINEVTTSGYYPDMNVVFENMPQHGFSTYNNLSNETDAKLKTAVALNAETGVSFKLSEKLRLYTGVYVNYGLNDMLKKENGTVDTPIVNYDANGNGNVQTNSILTTTHAADKAKLLGYGLQVKLGINLKKNKLQENVQVEEEIIPVEVIEELTVEEVVTEQPIDKTPAKPIEKKMTESEIEQVKQPVTLITLGSTQLTKANKEHLKEVAQILNEYSEQKVEVVGHTCDIGSEQTNLIVGEKRAQAVATYLETEGVNKERIEVKSDGETNPLYPNTSEANRKKNRRVSIELIK